MIYLNVTYDQKEVAKALGAKWDPVKKLWYSPNDSYKELIHTFSCIEKEKPTKVMIHKVNSISDETKLSGENRSYGNDLSIDIPPKDSTFTCYKHLSSNDYSILKKTVTNRCNFTCELCNESDLQKMFILERWQYHEKLLIQKLVRIMSVCEKCYQTTRLRSKEVAMEQLQWVNNWTEEEAKREIKRGFYDYKKKCEYEWILDVSLLPYENTFRKEERMAIKKLDDKKSEEVFIKKINIKK